MGKAITKKIKNPYFKSVWYFEKLWELRIEDDVEYSKDDLLILREYSDLRNFSGNEIVARVTEIYRDLPGLEKGYCIMSIRVIDRKQVTDELGEW